MKKLLLAISILAASTGVSLAEITLSGDARMGVIDDFGDDDTGFTSRARVKFTLSGETDGGLSFGASFRADNAVGAKDGDAGEVFISSGPLKVSMGDVDGAAQSAVGQVDGVGLTGLSDLNEIGFLGTGGASGYFLDAAYFIANPPTPEINGDPSLLVEYATGSLTLYASVTQPTHTFTEPCCTWTNTETISLGAAYALDAYKFSIGFERWDGDRSDGTSASIDNVVLGADATFGAVTLKARYSESSNEFDGVDFQDAEQLAVSATYTMDALSFTGFASKQEATSSGAVAAEREAFGLGASYDLGGGAKVVGGYVANDTDDTDAFDLGVSFEF